MLDQKQKSFLLVSQSLYPSIINFWINGAIAWLVFRHVERIPMWGSVSSVAGDTLATCFLLPCITCIAVTPSVRKLVSTGKVQSLQAPGWLQVFQRPLLLRAILLGLVGIALATVPLMRNAGTAGLLAWRFVWIKAMYAGLLGGMMTPFVAYLELSDTPKKTLPAESTQLEKNATQVRHV